jgi:glycogen debranching enzyme
MAELLRAVNRDAEADRQLEDARRLRALVEKRYWMPDEQFYAVALDREKQQVRGISSNAGHLLWCGLPSHERALAVARRLTDPDMFSGWGVRTLSSTNPSYNPLSYQNGSVWPHDTAIAAAGFARYGLRPFANTLVAALLAAAVRMPEVRLPEVLAGTSRAEHFLTPHPDSNSPQAWAAGAALLLPRVILRLVPDAPAGRCWIDPVLPAWLPRMEVRGVPVGGGEFSATLVQRGEGVELDDLEARGVEVVVGTSPAQALWGQVLDERGHAS